MESMKRNEVEGTKDLSDVSIDEFIKIRSSSNEDKSSEGLYLSMCLMNMIKDRLDDGCITNVDISDDEIIDKNNYRLSISFDYELGECSIFQKDIDEFVTSDISGHYEDTVDIDISSCYTVEDLGNAVIDFFKKKCDKLIEDDIDRIADEYHEPHDPEDW